MAIRDLFSKRQKRQRGEVPDVYCYDKISNALRVQLCQIIEDGIGSESSYGKSGELYEEINKVLCREYGVFKLTEFQRYSAWESIAHYLLNTKNVDHVLDIVELSLRAIDTAVRQRLHFDFYPTENPSDTIQEVNSRFKEHGVGFEYVSGELIRIDSQLMHQDVVRPALVLLADRRFSGPNDEFLKAHEHYRHGRYKECLNDALKSFESTMKVICDQKKWNYKSTDTAKALIDSCMNNGLFPSFMQSHVGSLRSILESGVPTVRNKQSGHGQGAVVTVVTQATAGFALHITASNIVFFVESFNALP